jgi:hypothetical protein
MVIVAVGGSEVGGGSGSCNVPMSVSSGGGRWRSGRDPSAPVSGGGVESPANHLREARFCGAHRNRGVSGNGGSKTSEDGVSPVPMSGQAARWCESEGGRSDTGPGLRVRE